MKNCLGMLIAVLVLQGCGGGEANSGTQPTSSIEPAVVTVPSNNNTGGQSTTSSGPSSPPVTTGSGPSSPPVTTGSGPNTPTIPNFGDRLDILIIGSSRSIGSARPFLVNDIATELEAILSADMDIPVQAHVEVEDIYGMKNMGLAVGQGGTVYQTNFYRHSLMQYYHWPEGQAQRISKLRSQGDKTWDYVVITADPSIIAAIPGYYALGVNKIAQEVTKGGAQPLLLLQWPSSADAQLSVNHFTEYTYRVGEGARVELPVVPAGLAWKNLSGAKRDSATFHPTANGAYIAAAAIYSSIMNRSAAKSMYSYDDEIADHVWTTSVSAKTQSHYSGQPSFMSPYKAANITDRVLNYNHTGTSSEQGILGGLKAVTSRARIGLVSGGVSPINFNYGRANTNFEASKQYKVDPSRFDFSLGFPMQDHRSTGDTTMRYGLDKRWFSTENGADLTAAFKMVNNNELPYARAVPIRTLFAQMKEAKPDFSAYRDSWHMSGALDKATASFMYTLLTGHNVLYNEPASSSGDWINWLAYKTGYETAWTLTTMKGRAPGLEFLPSSVTSKSVSASEVATLRVRFVNQPTENVTIRFSTDRSGALGFSPSEMTFTPENYNTAKTLTLMALPGDSTVNATITARSTSGDVAFDDVVEGWRYQVIR